MEFLLALLTLIKGFMDGMILGVIIIISLYIIRFVVNIISEISESNRNNEPKQEPIVYRQKSEEILNLLQSNKIKKVDPCFYIADNMNIKSKLSFDSHEDKIKFLKRCDAIEKLDGYITDFEVIILANSLNKLMV